MPPRSVIIAVVLFWLASSVWLFQREIRPAHRLGVPPRFNIAHDDDKTRERLAATWTAYHQSAGQPMRQTYRIQTSVVHHDKNKEDLFDLFAELKPAGSDQRNIIQVFHLAQYETTYKIRRDGRMIGFLANVEFRSGLVERLGDQTGQFEGVVNSDICHIQWSKQNKNDHDKGKSDVEVSNTGAILFPLHPLERMPGLRPGQQWGQFLFDPLDSASTPSAPPRLVWVDAEVRKSLEVLHWERQDYRCRIIDYKGEKGNIAGTIWVETASGQDKVLRVEFRLGDDTWDIRRGYDADDIREREGT